MALRFIGIDPGSEHGGCPSVWVDGTDGSFVIQGWEVNDSAELAEIEIRSPIASNEKIVRIPARMRDLLLEACGDGGTDVR